MKPRSRRLLISLIVVSMLLMPLISMRTVSAAYWYRVRLSWTDAASQKGAFSVLSNAIALAKSLTGYKVFDEEGRVVWPEGGSDPTPTPVPEPPGDIDLEHLSAALRDEFTRAQAELAAKQANYDAADTRIRSYGGVPTLPGEYYEKLGWLNSLKTGGSPIAAAQVRYHNLYNIGSTPNTSVIDGARINGVNFAMGKTVTDPAKRARYLLPWTNYERAAHGGAIYVRELYIDRGQDTVYFQKFNVAGDSTSPEWAQYMQGIQAPWSESRRAWAAYHNSNTLNGEIRFEIPVFADMPGAYLPRPASAAVQPAATEADEALASTESAPVTGEATDAVTDETTLPETSGDESRDGESVTGSDVDPSESTSSNELTEPSSETSEGSESSEDSDATETTDETEVTETTETSEEVETTPSYGYRSRRSAETTIVELFPGQADSPVDYSQLDAERDRVFIEDMAAFPNSYHAKLIALHLKYPQWRFIAVPTRRNWAQTVAVQMGPRVNLIEDTPDNNRRGWVANHVVHDGYNWVQVTEAAVQYHLDPRNFLEEPYIFMFEHLGALNSAQNLAGVRKIFEGNDDLLAIADIVFRSAQATNSSAYMLASRIRVEVSEGRRIANSARGTLDVNYPPLAPGADSLSFMTREQQITALSAFIARFDMQRQRYERYQADLALLEKAKTELASAQRSYDAVLKKVRDYLAANPAPTVVYGDLSGDRRVNSADLLMMRQALLGQRTLSATQLRAADLNRDGRVNSADLLMLRQALLGQRTLN